LIDLLFPTTGDPLLGHAVRRPSMIVIVLALAAGVAVAPSPAAAEGLTAVNVPHAKPRVELEGGGWGHSVGLSQFGAYAQSRAGRTFRQILKHYYRGIDVSKSGANPTIRVGLSTTIRATTVRAATDQRPIPWRLCDIAGSASTCELLGRQPAGATFQIARAKRPGGERWTIRDLSMACNRTKWPKCDIVHRGVHPSHRSVRVEHHRARARVQAYNPNYDGVDWYRWGWLEFSAGTVSNAAMVMVAHVGALERYLRGLGEVPSGWGRAGGMHALRAQAVTGRTYAQRHVNAQGLGLHRGCRCTILATPANQVFVGYSKELDYAGAEWVKAVSSTAGVVARYEGQLIDTVYSSSHGGRSENVQDSWAFGTAPRPYLSSVKDPWSQDPAVNNKLAGWSAVVPNAVFANLIGAGRIRFIKVMSRTQGGTPKVLRVGTRTNGRAGRTMWTGGGKGIAGVNLFLRLGVKDGVLSPSHPLSRLLPSQQLTRVGLGPFRDDDGRSLEYDIARISKARIIGHCNKGTDRFCPDRLVTRAQLAAYLVRAFVELRPRSGVGYADVKRGQPHWRKIESIRRARVAVGCNKKNTRYCPKQQVDRRAAASMLANALDLKRPRSRSFSDVAPNGRHAGAIEAIAKAGIMKPCAKDRFCPRRGITRARFARIFLRATNH
jgi:SpoIID/LytB domain protein